MDGAVMQILTWEQYSSFHNAVTQEEFDNAEQQAEIEVARTVGFIRWNEIMKNDNTGEFWWKPLQDCIANLIDYDIAEKTSGVGKGVTSVNNDGYSESYASDMQKASAAEEEKQKNIRSWLSGTGLVRAY